MGTKEGDPRFVVVIVGIRKEMVVFIIIVGIGKEMVIEGWALVRTSARGACRARRARGTLAKNRIAQLVGRVICTSARGARRTRGALRTRCGGRRRTVVQLNCLIVQFEKSFQRLIRLGPSKRRGGVQIRLHIDWPPSLIGLIVLDPY